MFCFRKFLWLVDLKICFCLKRARPWLEFRFNFNWYSMRSFWRRLLGLNNLWVHIIVIEFNCVSMSKIPIPLPLSPKTESWVRCLGGHIFAVPEEILYSFFYFVFDMFWNKISLASAPQLGQEDLVYDYLFTSQIESD